MDIDFAASEPHFADHLAPIAREAVERGHEVTFYVTPGAGDVDKRHPELTFTLSSPATARADSVTVCASWGDARNAVAQKRRVVLCEHGAGQSYSDRNPSYVGGSGRETLLGVLVPNWAAAERHQRFYHHGPPVEVIGSPRVDALISQHGTGRLKAPIPLLVVSWHWQGDRNLPETGSAFPELGEAILQELLRLERLGWIRLAGHAHPRADLPVAAYERLGIRLIEHFDGVCTEADIYMVDNSSTLYEFAALGRPVIVVNSPSYRRRMKHGLRFWEASEVGPNVWRRRDVAYAVAAAVEDGPARQKERRKAVEMAYSCLDGTSAARAVAAIAKMAEKAR